jgi:hypothetical protein
LRVAISAPSQLRCTAHPQRGSFSALADTL